MLRNEQSIHFRRYRSFGLRFLGRPLSAARSCPLVRAPGKVVVSDHVPGSKKIADGNYDPETRQLRVTFQDGTAEEVGL